MHLILNLIEISCSKHRFKLKFSVLSSYDLASRISFPLHCYYTLGTLPPGGGRVLPAIADKGNSGDMTL